MADRLEIYKGALRLLGPTELAALTDDRPERHRLDDAWRPAVDFLLTKGMWNFSIRAQELQQDEDVEPLFGYQYAFSKPDDWLRTVSISLTAQYEEGFEQYEDETSYWYADIDPMYVRFVSSDEAYGWNVGAWRQPFAKALEAYLAFECGLPISDDRGNRNDLYNLFKARLADAKTLDAIDERVRTKPTGRLVRARRSNRMDRAYRG